MEQMLLAQDDFSRFKSKARRSKLLLALKGKKDDLLSFEDVKKIMSPTGESYIGCKTVHIEQIVGCEGRAKDFNHSFCPRREFLRHRWCKVDTAYCDGVILPPVKLLELGGLYFVRDGNHRISIARAHRVAFIDAEVIRLDSKIRLHPKMTIGDIEQQVNLEQDGETAA